MTSRNVHIVGFGEIDSLFFGIKIDFFGLVNFHKNANQIEVLKAKGETFKKSIDLINFK